MDLPTSPEVIHLPPPAQGVRDSDEDAADGEGEGEEEPTCRVQPAVLVPTELHLLVNVQPRGGDLIDPQEEATLLMEEWVQPRVGHHEAADAMAEEGHGPVVVKADDKVPKEVAHRDGQDCLGP